MSFLVLLAMSMGELRTAALMSLRHGLRQRSALTAVVIVLAVLLFVARRL